MKQNTVRKGAIRIPYVNYMNIARRYKKTENVKNFLFEKMT